MNIAFEPAEYSLQHQIPNFTECWWDHVSGQLRSDSCTAGKCMLVAHSGTRHQLLRTYLCVRFLQGMSHNQVRGE